MRTDPFTDTWAFLLGNTPDHGSLGALRIPAVVLFLALLIGSAVVAWLNWQRDPAQRTAGNLWVWLFRLLMGCMWFQGATWKLPLPVSGGLQYWTGQMAEHAAFPFFADIVRNLILPNMPVFDPLILAVELGLAVSFMLGIFVRPVAVLGVPYALGLWIGLYRSPAEWPWQYIFIAIVHGQFAVYAAGRSLGLDRLLWPPAARPAPGLYPSPRPPPSRGGGDLF